VDRHASIVAYACVLTLALAAPACSDDERTPLDGGAAADAASVDAGTRADSGLVADADVTDAAASADAGVAGLPPRLEFDAPLGPEWSRVQGQAATLTVTGGELVVRLDTAALWFNASRGFFLHRPITGDFKATTRVRVRKTSAPAEAPGNLVHLAGVMVRDPASDRGDESYAFIVVGRDENDLSVETKETRQSTSRYEGPTWPSSDAELRLCRVGADVRLLKRAIGASAWTVAQTYARPDLPATLQVGLNVYAFSAPDLTARFDLLRFDPVDGLAACAAD
jgi:hypothetical protein